MVKNLEDASGEGDDARGGGVWLWESGCAGEGVFVGRMFVDSWAGRGLAGSLESRMKMALVWSGTVHCFFFLCGGQRVACEETGIRASYLFDHS